MEWLPITVTLLMFVYAGLFSMFAADFNRLDHPINLLLVLVGVALMIGGVIVSFWIYMQP